MGLPIRCLRIAANVNDILARTLKTGPPHLRIARSPRHASPSMDIQYREFRGACCSRPLGATRHWWARPDASLGQSGRFGCPNRSRRDLERVSGRRGRAMKPKPTRLIRAACARPVFCFDPHTAVALAVADARYLYSSTP